MEHFFQSYQSTIAALGAVSTFAAVVIALCLAISSIGANRSKLKARATITSLVQPGLAGSVPTFVTAEIVNTGALPLRLGLSFFRLRLPFQRGATMFLPQDSFSGQPMPKRQYPVVVQPNTSVSLFINGRDEFIQSLIDMKVELNWFGRVRFRWFRLCVLTDDGRWFRVRIDSILNAILPR